MQSVRIYEMPACKMGSSGMGMFGECFVWLYMQEDGMNVPKEFEITDFQGGLYAVATDIDQKTDKELMNTETDKFLSENGFERDASRPELKNIVTSPFA